LHGSLIVILSDVLPAGDLGSEVGGVDLAGSADGSVWIRGISVLSSGLDEVLIGVGWVSSVASLVDLVTINELLHGELDEWVSSDLPLGLNRLSGGERPARSTLLLVVDWGQGTLGAPVEGSWVGLDVLNRRWVPLVGRVAVVAGDVGVQVSDTELVSGQIGELGDTEDSLWRSDLELSGDLQVVLEDVETGEVLTAGVGLAIGLHEVLELGLLLREGEA